jgi:hypothetical protein
MYAHEGEEFWHLKNLISGMTYELVLGQQERKLLMKGGECGSILNKKFII